MHATHAAAAFIATNEHQQLQRALASHDLNVQAKGIIMERFQVNAVRAFEMLRHVSQDNNVKLVTVAEHVVLRWTAEPAVSA